MIGMIGTTETSIPRTDESATEGIVPTIGAVAALLDRKRVRPAGAGAEPTKPSCAGELTE